MIPGSDCKAMAYLKLVGGADSGQTWELTGPRCVLGRHPDCDISIDHLDASRHHAQLVLVGGDFFLEDLHSRNGTWLNGQRVAGRQKLSEGDSIRISESVFEFSRASSGRAPKATTSVLIEYPEGPSEVRAVVPGDASSSRRPGRPASLLEAEINATWEITRSLRGILAMDEAFPQILDTLFKIFPAAERGFIVFRGEDGAVVPRWLKVRDAGGGREVQISTTIVNRVMDSQQAVLSADAAGDFRFRGSQSLSEVAIRSVMCAPLIDADGRSFGALEIDTVTDRGRFNEESLHVLVAVAAQASMAFDHARLYETALRQRDTVRDLELADQIQRSFLPVSPPQVAGYRFFDYYRPASYVGGDFYNYLSLPDGRLAVVVADVVVHGLAAAMLTSKFATEVRYQLLTAGRPGEAVSRLNRALSETIGESHFITLVLVMLHPESGNMTLVNAGHPAPILFQPGGRNADIGTEESGFPLGVVNDTVYEECSVQVPPGGVVMVYTDGIKDAMNAEKQVYGLSRLRRLVEAASGDPLPIGQRIVDDVRQFIGSHPPADDMCLVCFQRE